MSEKSLEDIFKQSEASQQRLMEAISAAVGESKKEEQRAKWVVIIVLLAVVPAIMLRGWILSILWGWFVVPFGLPQIGIAWAIGLATVVSAITPTPTGESGGKTKTAKEQLGEVISNFLFLPLLILLFGWIVHGCM